MTARVIVDGLMCACPVAHEGGCTAETAKPLWTEAHRREAWARIFELTAAALREHTHEPLRKTIALVPRSLVATEKVFRVRGLDGFGFDPDRIDREVRRVRALAEGRLVRETRVVIKIGNGVTGPERRRVRRTSIRRPR